MRALFSVQLCVLCVSVVDEFRAKTDHRDTENTELHREIQWRDFLCKANRLKNAYDAANGVDWRLHDVNIVPVRSLE
jgi:hypothetical protein